jgi:sulfonate transport system substrate-binding protein
MNRANHLSTFSSVRTKLIITVGVLVLLLTGAAILYRRAQPETVVLHVGDQRGAIHSLLQAAGELDHVPYKIDWATFAVGAPLVDAMKAGAVDFGYVGSSTMTFGLVSGAPLKAISVWRFHGPGSGLLVRPGGPISAITDLRGKRIAVVRGSPAHLFVAELLRAANIPYNAVTIINLTPGDAKAALSTGAVDAWAIWDPYLAIGEREDHLRVLATSEQFQGEVECGVATEPAIATKRAQLQDFLGRVRRAYQWADLHQDAVAKVYASETGIPLDIARLVRGRMKVEVLPSVGADAIAAHQRGADIYADIGVIPKRLDVDKVYDRSFILPN